MLPSLSRAVGSPVLSRRRFLQFGGVAVTAGALAACDSDDPGIDLTDEAVEFDFADDFGVLNFAYVLEQLQAAFYTTVVTAPPRQAGQVEIDTFTALRDQEIAHRDFLRAAIVTGGGQPVPALRLDLRTVDFTSLASVLAAAQVIEDLAVAAYNGAGLVLRDADLLTIAGKIVSVEARHATAVRRLVAPDALFAIGAEADLATRTVDPVTGLDASLGAGAVLDAASSFFVAELTAVNLPS
ncbi:MAG: ferritin-like domain-containing protein [Bacteroidota bacterium]